MIVQDITPLRKALKDLQTRGFLAGTGREAEHLYLAVPAEESPLDGKKVTWGQIGRLLAEYPSMSAQWWKGGSGLTRVRGSQATYIVHPERLDGVRAARAAYYDLVDPTMTVPAPYSLSGIARKVIAWVGIEEPLAFRSSSDSLASRGAQWHFHAVRPGRLPKAYNWDLEACYWTILRRMPIPLVHLDKDRVIFRKPTQGSIERWRDALERLSTLKELRNLMIGVMSSEGSGEYFSRNKRGRVVLLHGRPRPGVLRPAGLLVVRTAMELCRLAFEEQEGVEANTDNVVSAIPTPPRIWTNLGFKVKLKESGSFVTYGTGNHIWDGERHPKSYRPAATFGSPWVCFTPPPPEKYRWLEEAA
jgi:hypothetical protein